MIITTKYSPGDPVFVLSAGKIYLCHVRTVTVTMKKKTPTDLSISYIGNVIYQMWYQNEIWDTPFYEKDVFENRQVLINSL